MPSPQIIQLEKTLQNCSSEDKHWLLERLMQQLGLNYQKLNSVSYKQEAKDIIAETINEVLTSIFISVLLSKNQNSAPCQIIRYWKEGKFNLVISPQLLEELVEKLLEKIQIYCY